MKQDYLDFVRQVLDRKVVVTSEVPCKMADESEFEGGTGGNCA